jgi:ketosteroid isomerase-like protein
LTEDRAAPFRQEPHVSQENVDLVRSLYEAFGSGDMETVTRLIADTEWHEAEGLPYGGTYHGAEAIFGNVFGPITEDVENFSVQPDEILDAGEKVVSLGRYAGQGASGPLAVPFAHVWTVRDGAVARFDQYTDTKLFSEAIGR